MSSFSQLPTKFTKRSGTCVGNRPWNGPALIQTNRPQSLPFYFFVAHFNIILPFQALFFRVFYNSRNFRRKYLIFLMRATFPTTLPLYGVTSCLNLVALRIKQYVPSHCHFLPVCCWYTRHSVIKQPEWISIRYNKKKNNISYAC